MDGGSLGDLFRGTPRDILERLADGDPLELGARVEERLDVKALLLDVERILPKACAQVAFRTRELRLPDGLERYLRACIDRAVADAMREDREEERQGTVPPEPYDRRYAFLAEALGIETPQARRACVRFNDLPLAVRRTYFAVCVDHRSIEEWAADGGGPRKAVEEHLRRAFQAMSLPFDTEGLSGENRPGGEG